ncbi:MAG: hypothetical protein J5885_01760 [Clostridia bacterium]|nr:hypothetical protein [Clostridia bacterium]
MHYRSEDGIFLLSVREVCDFALLSGDLDLRAGHRSLSRAEQGKDVHKRLQKALGEGDRAEVSVSSRIEHHGRVYEINGRVDAVLCGDPPTVEEIKSVTGRGFSEPNAYHKAQANLTAWLFLREQGLSSVRVRYTLFSLDDEKTKVFEALFSEAELEQFCLSLLSRIEYRAAICEERERVLLPSVGKGRFPYGSVREAQDIMLRECYRDIRRGKRLFMQAPTGVGKTVSALYPAVRALGEGKCDRIFYLTAKTATAREAYRAAADIFRAGSHLRTIVLSSREQLCANEAAKSDPAGISRHCNPKDCPRARDFYDRCAPAICDLIAKQSGYPRATVAEVAERYGICPYEFQLELSEFCDIVICDYNYVFDPMVYLRRYFEADARVSGRFVFLIDEAHNLGDRACAMYSAELSVLPVETLIRALLAAHPSAGDELSPFADLIGLLRGMKSLCRDTLTKTEDGTEQGYYFNRSALPHLDGAVSACRECAEIWLRAHAGEDTETELICFISALRRFETVLKFFDDRFLTFVTVRDGDVTVRLICLDPSEILSEKLSLAKSAVLFSATLTPLDYFADILGGGKEAVKVALPSPYDPENLCVAAVPVNTRYEDREGSVKRLASIIAATVSAKAGNYIVYFPSYDYMEKVQKAFSAKYAKVPVVVQSRGMSAEQREAFLDAFRDDGKLRVGFCVLGGSFSEGVDLPGGRLIGAVVVGVGLPGLSDERNLLRDYYEATRERGYDYAYTYPGMNRVLQAAGRVIRSETDRGVIVLADDRWQEPRYQMLIPEHWNCIRYATNAAELANIAADFWKSSEK